MTTRACAQCGVAIQSDERVRIHHLDYLLYLDGEQVGRLYWDGSAVCEKCRTPRCFTCDEARP